MLFPLHMVFFTSKIYIFKKARICIFSRFIYLKTGSEVDPRSNPKPNLCEPTQGSERFGFRFRIFAENLTLFKVG